MHAHLFLNFPSKYIYTTLTIFVGFYPIATVYAETTLPATPCDSILTASGNPYIVETEITIPKGHRLCIKEGCMLFFRPFTGITVEGSLIVEGTSENPVIFTSVNDSLLTPNPTQLANPFDWNGIYITHNADNVELSCFSLMYSVYGIKSQKAMFSIVNGTFRQNGQYNCTVDEVVKQVVEGIPFTYSPHQVLYDRNGATSGNVPVDTEKYNSGMPALLKGNDGKLVKPGSLFSGWNTASDGSGRDYTPGSVLIIENQSVRLFAKWVSTDIRSSTGVRRLLTGKEIPFIIGGAGIVCGGISIAYFKYWLEGNDDYHATTDLIEQKRLSRDGTVFSTVSISAGVVAGIAIATGVVLYFKNSSPQQQVTDFPSISINAMGVAMAFKIPRRCAAENLQCMWQQ